MTDDRFGFELPLLLAAAFRALIDGLHDRLAEQGHPDARPIHGFALQAIGPRSDRLHSSAVASLSASRQQPETSLKPHPARLRMHQQHPTDARAVQLQRSLRGEELLLLSAEILGQLRAGWAHELGDERLHWLEDDLETIAGAARLEDLPGWIG